MNRGLSYRVQAALFKNLIALTLFVLALVFESITKQYKSVTDLFLIFFISLTILNTPLYQIVLSVTLFTLSIVGTLGHVLLRIFRTRKVYIILFSLVLYLLLPLQASAFEFDSPPQKIIIPSLSLSLPVHTAKIAYNTWEVRLDGASYGEHTTLPGQEGNTVIFSHALPQLFGDLPKIKKGELIHVFTDKDWFTYKVIDTMTVAPQKTDVIFSSSNHELTLYTCTGQDYEKRFVVKTKLISPVN